MLDIDISHVDNIVYEVIGHNYHDMMLLVMSFAKIQYYVTPSIYLMLNCPSQGLHTVHHLIL